MPSPSTPATTVHPAQPSPGAVDLSRPQTASGAELLSEDEEMALSLAEGAIRDGIAAFRDVGRALAGVRDARLYRATHATFEDYCRERWGWSRQRGYQLMAAAEAIAGLPLECQPAVDSERAARELAKVEPEKRAGVLAQVAAAGPVTARAIKAAAQPKPAPAERTKPMPPPDHPDPVREDAETRQFRIARRIQEMKADLKGFLSAQNPTKRELVAAAVSMRTLAKELDYAAAQLGDHELA
mgnify:CR=1 FL=1